MIGHRLPNSTNLKQCSSSAVSYLLTIETSLQHADFNPEYRDREYQKETQVENSDRVRAVMKAPFGIIHRNSLSNTSVIRGAFPAKLGDITRVHDAIYIKKIKDKCMHIDDGDITDFDPDTPMSKETWEASINSSGSCLEAARRIMRKEAKNAF